ncbi:hypothetical protein BN903_105 [Halorubrum sp. AJ67]|nr:hypothetical protein BN903_105 [Halorubrum sp. AJ67]
MNSSYILPISRRISLTQSAQKGVNDLTASVAHSFDYGQASCYILFRSYRQLVADVRARDERLVARAGDDESALSIASSVSAVSALSCSGRSTVIVATPRSSTSNAMGSLLIRFSSRGGMKTIRQADPAFGGRILVSVVRPLRGCRSRCR